MQSNSAPPSGDHPASSWHGIRLSAQSLGQAIQALDTAATEHRPLATHLCNAYTLALSRSDAVLRASLTAEGSFNLLDGVPVAWMLKLAGHADPQHSRGPSLFVDGVRRLGHHRQVFLGGSPETASAIRARLATEGVPRDPVVISPPYEPLSDAVLDRYVRTVAEHAPNVVWVGLGTPKQDVVVAHLAAALSVPCVAVGAAFDFYAGTVREAPALLQDSGMEWVYRLAAEPRRLWRRYLIGNAVFLRASVPVVRRARARSRVVDPVVR